MAIYMPPICRKKKVLDRYNPDTFRVISQDAENTHLKSDFEEGNKPSEWRRIWLENSGLALPDIYNRKTEVLPKSVPDYRLNKPHPSACGFLRHNVRLLNEPICSVYTEITREEQDNWWPSRVSNEPLRVPPKTTDTIYRADFSVTEDSPVSYGYQRHTSNPNKEPALGSVPVNFLCPRDGKQRLLKEKVSYEHQYNSRIDPNYPIRGKRHGSFVWDQMSPDATSKFVNHYKVISPEEGVRRQDQMKAEKLAEEVGEVTQKVNEATEKANQVSESGKVNQVIVEEKPSEKASTETKAAEKTTNPVQKEETIGETTKIPTKASPKGSPKNSAPSSPKRKSSDSSSQQPTDLTKPEENVQAMEADNTLQEPTSNPIQQ